MPVLAATVPFLASLRATLPLPLSLRNEALDCRKRDQGQLFTQRTHVYHGLIEVSAGCEIEARC
jgi:hypothetical protein